MPANKDLQLLIEAAHAAGDIARRYFKDSPETWDKGDGAGPVTEADLKIDRMLHAELRAARPDYGWLSEETEDTGERLNHETVFIIDPIDGTRAFIAGETTFSHSLAVVRDGQVTDAVVYLPMQDKLYSASAGQASRLNGATLKTSAVGIEGATILAARPNLDAVHWHGSVPPLDRHFRPSLAYRLCLVAEGKFDAMLTLRDCWEWDIAAGALIVAQAGGLATDRRSDPLQFNSAPGKTPGCHAAGPKLHAQIQSRLRVD